jgi:hypothetical protein
MPVSPQRGYCLNNGAARSRVQGGSTASPQRVRLRRYRPALALRVHEHPVPARWLRAPRWVAASLRQGEWAVGSLAMTIVAGRDSIWARPGRSQSTQEERSP